MFRSLAARLTATYVFAAIVLVVIVVAAVTTLALSEFGSLTRQTSDAVARAVPDEYHSALARSRDPAEIAKDLARHLSRPGIRIIVFSTDGHDRRWLASSVDPAGNPVPPPFAPVGVAGGPGAAPPHDGEPPPGFGPGGPGPGGWPRYDHGRQYPFGLNQFLGLHPRSVFVDHVRVTILPDPSQLETAINGFWLAMIPIGLFAIGSAWLLGRYITGQALRPLVETTASLRRFGAGDFTPRAIVTMERNEIGELARAYNAAAAQVSAAFEERRAAETQMRQFIADAGHELRTPLTVIMGFIDVLRRRAQGEGGIALRIYDTMLEESRRMRTLIEKLILLARLENPQERELETVDLGAIAGQVVATLEALQAKPRVRLHTAGDALVRGYENELHDALTNLVENALKYAPDSPVEVRVRVEASDALVDVADSGPGIPADEQERVFDRFYRGREHGDAEGFGLGLAIARRAVLRAGGRLALHSVPGEGSRFTMVLPLATRGEPVTAAV